MNILPKKRWHVRTKENIARVRKDEAEAAEKERLEQLRIQKADQEARLNVLKNKSKQRLEASNISLHEETTKTEKSEHINFFEDIEHAVQTTNKEHDLEVKNKQEEYEKKIGYLTYLGQDTNEALGKKNWYEVLPDSSRFSRSGVIKDTYEKLVLKDDDGKPKVREPSIQNGEVDFKTKQKHDPIKLFAKYCSKIEKKKSHSDKKEKKYKKSHKHEQKKDNDKLSKLKKLREARLKREQQERLKTNAFLKGLSGEVKEPTPPPSTSKVKPKYNSQFNPELARQNFH